MATLTLPSNINEAEIVQLVISFLLGLLIGKLIRKVFVVSLIPLVVIVIVLMVAGYVSPQQIEALFNSSLVKVSPQQIEALFNSSLVKLQSYTDGAQEIVKFIPHNLIAFIIGFVIGLAKG
jgi:uncharacterized membrane protein (Fun14 family)